MKALKIKLIVVVLTFASFCLAGGGSGGGVATIKYVTVEVCDGGETNDRCRLVTYKVRPPNPIRPDMCMIGETGEEKPCAQIETIPPTWFKNLGAATNESTGAVSNTNNNNDSDRN